MEMVVVGVLKCVHGMEVLFSFIAGLDDYYRV